MIRSFLGSLWCKNFVLEGSDVVGGDVVVYGVMVGAIVGVEEDVVSSVLFIFLSILACSGLLILKDTNISNVYY